MSLPTARRHKLGVLPGTRGLRRSPRTSDPGLGARFSLASSTLFVMGASLGAALLGFLREAVNAKYYGTQWQMDTFLAASVIPTILFGIFGGALIDALVPTFSEYIGHQRSDEAWRLGSTIVNLLGLIMLGCAVLGYVLAPWYVPLVAHGFPKPQTEVAIRMTRLLMPSIVGVALAGVLSGILNAFRRFRAAAIVGMVLNLVTIATVIILNHRFGIFALVFGTTLGLVAQLVVQIPVVSVARRLPARHRLPPPWLEEDAVAARTNHDRLRGGTGGAFLQPLLRLHVAGRAHGGDELR